MSQRPYELDLYAARNRERAYEAVVTAIEDSGVTKKSIADATGKKAPQITMMLSGPSNWTLDTVSDLLRPIHATMEYAVVYDADRPKSNIFNSVTTQVVSTGTTLVQSSQVAMSTTSNVVSIAINLLTDVRFR